MALKVTKCSGSGMYMNVTVQSDKREELEGNDARNFAQQHAQQQGFNARALKDVPAVYPVNEQGEATDAVALGTEKLAGWQSEFVWCTGI